MAQRTVRDWCASIVRCIAAESGRDLAAALRVHPWTRRHGRDPASFAWPAGGAQLAAAAATLVSQLDDAVLSSLQSLGSDTAAAWTAVLAPLLRTSTCCATEPPAPPLPSPAAFDHAIACLEAFVTVYSTSSTDWLVDALSLLVSSAYTCMTSHMLVHTLAAAPSGVHVDAGAEDRKNRFIQVVRNAFSACMSHRVSRSELGSSRRRGALIAVNALFRTYFGMDSHALRQCKFFTRVIEGPTGPPLDLFPLSQVVTYRAFTGRLGVWEDAAAHARAQEALMFALGNCHKGYTHNRRVILISLIPVRMSLGLLPSPALLHRHGLANAFQPLADALANGDVRAWTAALETNKAFYVRTGIYLLLESMSMLVYRTLLRRICRLLVQDSKSSKLSLPVVCACARAAGVDMDMDELFCILAHMISKKYVRGYLSYAPPALVLAKTDTWTPLRSLAGAPQ